MKAIYLTIIFLFISFISIAQTFSEVYTFSSKAMFAMEEEDFEVAKDNYDKIIEILFKTVPNLNPIDYKLAEYIITKVSILNINEGKKYADEYLEILSRIYWRHVEKRYTSIDIYVNDLSLKYLQIAFIFRDLNAIDLSEYYLTKATDIYIEHNIYNQNYADNLWTIANFYQTQKKNYANSISYHYKRFKILCNLYNKEDIRVLNSFDTMLSTYVVGTLSLDEKGKIGFHKINNINVDYLSYSQYSELLYQWRTIIQEVERVHGKEYFDKLLRFCHDEFKNGLSQDINKFTGEDFNEIVKRHVVTGSISENLKFEIILNISFDRIEKYYDALEIFLEQIPIESNCYYELIDDISQTIYHKGYTDLCLSFLLEVRQHILDSRNEDIGLFIVICLDTDIVNIILSTGLFDNFWWFINSYIAGYETYYATQKCDIPDHMTAHKYIEYLYTIERVYKHLGMTNKRLKILDNARTIITNNNLVNHYVEESMLYRKFSDIAFEQNEIEKAIDYQLKAIQLYTSFDNHLEYGWPVLLYEELAEMYIADKQCSKAEDILVKAVEHCLMLPSLVDDRLLPSVYETLVHVYRCNKDYHKMSESAKEMYFSIQKRFWHRAFAMKKENVIEFYNSSLLHNQLEFISSFALENELLTDLCYNISLSQKDFFVNYDKTITDNVRKCTDIELKKLYNRFKDRERAHSDSLWFYENQFLYRYSQHIEFKNIIHIVKWTDVQQKLNQNDIAVEFTRCLKGDWHSDNVEDVYAVLLLKEGWEMPKIMEICTVDRIDNIISRGAQLYIQNDDAYSYIWEKLEPYLDGVENIYFAPHGLIHQMNIEVLAGKDGIPMNKKYNVYRVSSTGNLVDKREDSKYSSATLFGGLNYDTDTTSLVAMSRNYAHISPSRDRLLRDTVQTRAGWSYLPGTATEVKNVSSILEKNRVETKMFTDKIGTEESFKALSGNSPSIIHIATHGFYLEDKKARRVELFSSLDDRGTTQISPLKRSGLMFSGGQHAWLGKDIPEGIDDGVLTAEEIAGMNLSGTDLLVLSACQTGLGEITSEGVEGLQKGFKIAGVNTIIMSLWEVSDVATEMMMTTFYKNLTKGKSKREAFDKAVEAVKKKYPSPEYWAAFVMLD